MHISFISFLCLVLVEPKAPCYRAHVCVRNSGFSRILRQQPETTFEQCSFDFRIPRRHDVDAYFLLRSLHVLTLRVCSTTLVSFLWRFKINLSYFPSRARLNFRWIFKEFDLKSNMKGFFENFLALSVKKLKKVLMILSSITGRGRAFLAESCRYMPCLAIRRWNFHAKVENPKVNSQKVYHDDRSTLVGECCKLSRDENAKALCKRTRLYSLYNSIKHQTCVCTPFQVPYYTQLNKSDAV